MTNYSNIALEQAALGYLGCGLSKTGMTAEELRELGRKVLVGEIIKPATKTYNSEGEATMEKPYVAKEMFTTGNNPNQPADRRLSAAVAHLQEVHGPAAEGRIRAMSGAALILLGERVLADQVVEVNSASGDQGVYVARTLFGG